MDLQQYYDHAKLNELATLGEWIMACGGEVVDSFPALRFKSTSPSQKEIRIEYNSLLSGIVLTVVGAGNDVQQVYLPGIADFVGLSSLYRMLSGRELFVKDMLYLRMKVILRELHACICVGDETTKPGICTPHSHVSLEMLSVAV